MRNWKSYLALGLVLFSALVYTIHYFIFKDAHHIFLYLVSDIAFVPLEVLLVTLMIHKVLESRERQARLKKMNMVIGTFFSELGNDLLESFVDHDVEQDILIARISVDARWDKKSFLANVTFIKSYSFKTKFTPQELGELREFMKQKKDFLLSLLGNANLLEHDSFSDLLWAIFHLVEELSSRKSLDTPEIDQKHLRGDVRRAYANLFKEWLYYLNHLQKDYPYLFSLAVRTSPLLKDASPIVEG